MNRLSKSLLASGLALGLLSAGATVASASENGELRLVVLYEEGWTDVDMETLEAAALDLESPTTPPGDKPTSRLIDWNQWFGCFSLNHESDVFAHYWFPWNGRITGVNLKCGTEKWGYKHIRQEHEGDWQNTLDKARERGWQSSQFGVESWDDLMSGVTAGIVADPGPGLTKSSGNKWCTLARFGLWDSSWNKIVYEFTVEAAWASDSDRLITSFPSGRKAC